MAEENYNLMPIPQTAKQIAISAAKQVLHESNEILKSVGEQIAPIPELPKPKNLEQPEEVEENKPKDLSFLNVYKSELDEIRRENLFKELQRKISEGEDVYIENYAMQLASEQKDVLKAQMEAVKMQKEATKVQQRESPLQVVAKKGRNAMMGMFKKKNEQHVEMRQPPSG